MQLLPLIGLAIVDSLNPSAIAVTLYLLTCENPTKKVLAYVAGIFTTYLTLGLLLVAGLSAILSQLGNVLENPVAYGMKLAIGVLMLGYALVGDILKLGSAKKRLPKSQRLPALFGLGVVISVAEFATALPYLATIAILLDTPIAFAAKAGVLVGYNLIMILPLILLLVAFHFGVSRWKDRIDIWQQRLNKEARETMYWIVGIIGFLLISDAAQYFGWFDIWANHG